MTREEKGTQLVTFVIEDLRNRSDHNHPIAVEKRKTRRLLLASLISFLSYLLVIASLGFLARTTDALSEWTIVAIIGLCSSLPLSIFFFLDLWLSKKKNLATLRSSMLDGEFNHQHPKESITRTLEKELFDNRSVAELLTKEHAN